MTYKKGTSDVFLKFVAQADKLKQIKKICDSMLRNNFKDCKFYPELPTNKQQFHLILNKFKIISDIIGDNNENK
ncbi:hypothetical protein HX837_04540 [Marine Group I thaumarchaeote]|uniref:Uncharacterized protein n=1 Tax=Marine Group I thaumarchaeote TaxID=2511932 RepID=A0A7K4MPH7_9ARCH|nr:hypothetical protein [Marine Group I thaumarchaeote]